ncbi:acyltransferase [Smaragdicoccus niigatensis]|uniref:acyltransferase n=1 Tax=Smaragdicoccus niigatensis TaxID=359359 RepID=UPI00036E9219|nr:acyltransferase [Smaragdicoccus niigatensis]
MTATEQQLTGAPVDDRSRVAKRDKHLHQIDLFRLITFGGVILDHVLLNVVALANVAAGGMGLLLRYTRYGFFGLTGFVLAYQYRSRELHAPTFWRRRFKLVGLPFVTWSLFYWLYGRFRRGELDDVFASAGSLAGSAKSVTYDLVTGNAWGHLYFLSVSMQIYAVFPLLLWVLRRTWGFHRYLLAASFAFQATVMLAMVRPVPAFFADGLPSALWRNLDITLIPYQFFVVAGAMAALHFDAFTRLMVRWRALLIVAGAAVIAVTLMYYVQVLGRGEPMDRATNVFMLHNVFAFISIIVIVYCLGTVWQERRTPGSGADRFLKTASDRSFGIYLAHALALDALLPQAATWNIPTVPRVLITYAATVALTVFIVEVLRRSPISLITTGRERIDWRSQNSGRSMLVGAAGIALGFVLKYGFDLWVGGVVVWTGVLLIGSAAVVARRQRRDVPSVPDEVNGELVRSGS